MSDQIGGAISSITAMSSQAQSQADEAAAATQDTQALVAEMQDEVDAIATHLRSRFGELAGVLRDQVQQTSNQLHATEWSGKSREALVAFDQDLNGTVNRFMDASDTGMEEFRTQLMSFIGDFHATIQGEFTTAMNEIQTKYGDASRAAQTYADNLVEMDSTTIQF